MGKGDYVFACYFLVMIITGVALLFNLVLRMVLSGRTAEGKAPTKQPQHRPAFSAAEKSGAMGNLGVAVDVFCAFTIVWFVVALVLVAAFLTARDRKAPA